MKQPMGMSLPGYFGRGSVKVHAGPYGDYPGVGYWGIKLDKRPKPSADLFLDLPDFQAPTAAQVYLVLNSILDRLLAGEKVYLGCFGGMGRTGTFLACLAKLWGEDDGVLYARQHYWNRAVETPEQADLVESITFPLALKFKAMRLKTKAFWANRALTDAVTV